MSNPYDDALQIKRSLFDLVEGRGIAQRMNKTSSTIAAGNERY
jgi:hypothetical protein